MKNEQIDNRTADVLLHTSRTGRYVTDETAVLNMAKAGLLRDHGPQRLADGMHYFTMTPTGREALNSWKANQPPPEKVKARRRSPAFVAWRDYCEAFKRISFSEFWKELWPTYQQDHPLWTPEGGDIS